MNDKLKVKIIELQIEELSNIRVICIYVLVYPDTYTCTAREYEYKKSSTDYQRVIKNNEEYSIVP